MKHPLRPALLLAALLPGCRDFHSPVLWLVDHPEKPVLEAVDHEDVRLEDLLANPEHWLDRGVRFECRFHAPSTFYAPAYARFTADTHVNFSVWTTEARFWEPEVYADDHPVCYVDRIDLASNARLRKLKPFERIEVEALVSAAFAGRPYLRVDAIRRVGGGPDITTEGLREIHEALTLERDGRWSEGVPACRTALRGQLPAGSEGELRKALGRCLLESGDAKTGLAELRQAASMRPDDMELLKLEGRASRELALAGHGSHDRSVEFLERARRTDPDDAEVPLLLSEAYAAAGRPKEALRSAKEGVEMNPLDPDATFVLAGLQDAQGDLEGSARSYRESLELDDDRWQAWSGLARVQVKQADFEGAAKSFERAFLAGGAEVPADDHYLAGRAYEAMNQAEPSRKHFQAALNVEGWAGAADAHAALGELAYRGGDWAGAEKAYEAALVARPKDAEFLGCLGMARLKAGKFPEAREVLEASLDQGVEKKAVACEALAKACLGSGDLKACRRAAEKACKAEETAERRFLLGEVCRRMLDPKDAAKAFERAAELDPKDTAAWLNLGIVNTELERWKKADEALSEAAKLEPENPFVLTMQAYLLLVQGQDGALQPAEKAFAKIPENPDACHTYGWALLVANRPAEALPVLQTAAAAGDFPQVHFHLAQAWVAAGKPDQARPILENLKKSRGGEYSREARKLLKTLPEPAPAP